MRILLSLLLILVFSVAGAQSLLDSVGNPGFNLQDTLSEKLADLAISNRNVIVEQRDLDVKKYEMKKNRAAWLNNIGANFNLNRLTRQAARDPARSAQSAHGARHRRAIRRLLDVGGCRSRRGSERSEWGGSEPCGPGRAGPE